MFQRNIMPLPSGSKSKLSKKAEETGFWVVMPFSFDSLTFQRNILPLSSRSKSKPSKESAGAGRELRRYVSLKCQPLS
jgi:hypothetical protein